MTTPQQPAQMPKKSLPAWAKVLIVLLIIGFAFATLAGIGVTLLGRYLSNGGAEKLIEQGIEKAVEHGLKEAGEKNGADVDVNLGDKGFVIKDEKSGEEFSIKADNKIPADFPKDIPVFSPAAVVSSMVMGGMQMLTLETSAPLDEVSQFYKTKLSEAGWQSPFSGSFAQDTQASLYQKENRQLTLSISTQEGKTMIVLSNAATPAGL
ncbi:MAG: hypothetical protein ACD_73C00801G0002 [uncultured bacterium]|nr:MAG: hypothetical protein ACD_73C00801G0002 [uncultured bacterium]